MPIPIEQSHPDHMRELRAKNAEFIVRPYRLSDRPAVQRFSAADEHERPGLLKKYPRFGEYRADGLAHYYDLEPESCFVAESGGEFIGNVLGAVDSVLAEQREKAYIHRLRRKRLLLGAYGIPIWLVPIMRTERAPRISEPPKFDLKAYPGDFHIGVKREWRRRGVGTALMGAYEVHLQSRGVPGYHVYVSSYHHEGVSFFRKLGFQEVGQFQRRFHDGFRWLTVAEHVFLKGLQRV